MRRAKFQKVKKALPSTVVGYIRVSTEEQADSGLSLEGQRERIMAYCKARELELVDVFEDAGVSGSTLDRPGIQAALKALKSGSAAGMVVYKLDRLSRSLRDLLNVFGDYFEGKYAFIAIVDQIDTSTPTGRVLLYILGFIAQIEREAISDRTKMAMAQLKSQGVHTGAAPYGYTYGEPGADGRRPLITVPEEIVVIQKIIQAKWRKLSLRAIAKELNDAGVKTKSEGARWSPQTISDILRRSVTVFAESVEK